MYVLQTLLVLLVAFFVGACGGGSQNPFANDASTDTQTSRDTNTNTDTSVVDTSVAGDTSVVDTNVVGDATVDAPFACTDSARPDRCANPDRCVNFTNDRSNCGACGRTCGGAQLCQNSECVDPPACSAANNNCTGMSYCELTTMVCSPGCDGTRSEQCDSDRMCMTSSHTCVCRSGLRACGSACAVCPSGTGIADTTCLGEACVVATCAAGYERNQARTACVDVDECSNPNACSVPNTCVNQAGTFACECRAPNRMCGNSCATCPSDPNATATTCATSTCVLSGCAAGFMLNQARTACVAQGLADFVAGQEINTRPSGTSAFARSVALSPDGLTFVVGDINFTPSGSTAMPGAIHVFVRSSVTNAFGSAPNQTLFLADGLTFGQSLAFSGDGRLLAVGDSNYGASALGAVFLYTRSSATGNFASNPTRIDAPVDATDFATSLSMSSDATILIVGDAARRVVHTYRRADANSAFAPESQLTLVGASTFFGFAVALSADGLQVAVGDRDAPSAGILYLYARADRNTPFATSVQTLAAPATSTDFGSSVVFSRDTLTLIVGDNSTMTTNGAVFVFSRASASSMFGSTPTQTIVRSGTSPNLGISVSLSSDSRILAIGDNDSTSGTGPGVGAAFLYIR